MWTYLAAIVLIPVALAVLSHLLESHRAGETLQEEMDWPFHDDKAA
jgi:hypothetical protein